MHNLSVQARRRRRPTPLDSEHSTFITDRGRDEFKINAENSPQILVSDASDNTDQIASTNSREDASTCITGPPPTKIAGRLDSTALPPPFPDDDKNDDEAGYMHTRSFSSLLSTDAEPSLGFTPLNNQSRFIRAIRMVKKKRRGSIGEGTLRRQKAISVPVEPRLTKSSIHPQQHRYSSISARLEEEQPMWDPHIDAFEILRAKITGITRTMQEFHVQELFQDELSERRERRMSTSTEKKKSVLGHRRIRSHGTVELMLHKGDDDSDSDAINSPPPPPPAPMADQTQRPQQDVWSHLRTDDDFKEDMLLNQEQELVPPTSPNLTALFLTTNSLINSRLDELSETASIASSCDLNSPTAEWRSQFLELVSSCITQSEGLESLSTELLGTERRVRELLVLDQTVEEQYKEREKAYEERIRECEDVAKQQLLMIDTLEELTADLEMKMEQLKSQQEEQDEEDDTSEESSSVSEDWDFRRRVADIIDVETKDDLVHKMRWQVGMFVGGGVGTGHVIHTFEGRLRGIEMMIAGSGTTTVDEYSQQPVKRSSTYQSRSIRHTQFHHHHYLLHLLPEDRKRFRLIPRAHWVPDQLADQCQFERSGSSRCPSHFTFFQRKHHCRRCGKVVCQRHSSNRLPLFATPASPPQWSRVCDKCFCDLIIVDE